MILPMSEPTCASCNQPILVELCGDCQGKSLKPSVPVEGARVCGDCKHVFGDRETCPRCSSRSSVTLEEWMGRGEAEEDA